MSLFLSFITRNSQLLILNAVISERRVIFLTIRKMKSGGIYCFLFKDINYHKLDLHALLLKYMLFWE